VIRVIVADDHDLVLQGMKAVLAAASEVCVIGEARDFPSLQKLGDETDWDVMVMDMRMPGGHAVEMVQRFRSRHPDRGILVLSAHSEDQFGVRLIRAGASGFVSKETVPDDLVTAVRTAATGRSWVSPGLGDALAARLRGDAPAADHTSLSDREFQVMCGLAEGHSTADLAESLHLSAKTVSTYRRRLLDKMGFSSNAELTRYALEHDLI